ncbi:hypothetical protein CBER1_10822 [Cercospora berteroae]|uniref:Arrestin-like N-terminal domain-containing protein n=1 Tax=Cercospora berteroae TaxID=357750 RepID=A0A2S6BYY3_9PEZI|nr:hypothetical protein CBER1_10822 [Cercospora berteroae]
MPRWLPSPSVEARIDLDATSSGSWPQSDTHIFTGSQPIVGRACFLSKKPQTGLRYRVIVKGVIETRIANDVNGSIQSNTDTQEYAFVSSVLFDGQMEDGKSKNEIPFDFTLAKWEPDTGARDEYARGSSAQGMPPSISSKQTKRRWSENFSTGPAVHYKITYKIVASAFRKGDRIAAVSRPFEYIPALHSPPPPIPTEDYPEEYMLRTTKMVRKASGTTQIGVIGQEPAPLTIYPGQNQAHTKIDLLFILVRNQSADAEDTIWQLPRSYCVKAQLKTTTFVMQRPAPRALHVLESNHFNRPIVRERKDDVQVYENVFAEWEVHDSSDSDDKSRQYFKEITTAGASTPFTISIDPSFTPDFWTPLLSRRHAIELSVTFDKDSSTTTKLRLPVQIHHAS